MFLRVQGSRAWPRGAGAWVGTTLNRAVSLPGLASLRWKERARPSRSRVLWVFHRWWVKWLFLRFMTGRYVR
ncbi:hypothetical protein, partial [Mycobacterium leprae]|uniref:hypothetical protein n=1 Tax=Mycobacterium leprae TaxID=1769 RepID=UPI001E2FB07A